MYGNHGRYNRQELYNTELKRQRDNEKKDELMHKTGWHTSEQIVPRNIRTTEDAERTLTRFAVARADVVSQDLLDLHVTLSNVVWAGGTGGAPRQPATYGI